MAKYKLGDICTIISGSTPKTGIEEYWKGNLKWITPAEIEEDTYIISDSERKITELAVKKTGLSSFPFSRLEIWLSLRNICDGLPPERDGSLI